MAVNAREQIQLDQIYKRGLANGLAGIRKINPSELAEIEPHAKGVEAIWVPQAGITDYKKVAEKYLELVTDKGGRALFGAKVLNIRRDNNQVLIPNRTRGSAVKTRDQLRRIVFRSDSHDDHPRVGVKNSAFPGGILQNRP
nr:FAD-dependent oxidoreductase [Haliscomenobacter sp.]